MKLFRPNFISKSIREDRKFKAEVKIFDIIRLAEAAEALDTCLDMLDT